MTIKLIVGLANPGIKYALTRHNVGSWYVDLLVKKTHTSLLEKPDFYGLSSCINLFNANIHLLVPTTSMNLSGKSVSAIANFYKINPNEILIAHDELDLLPGTAKFKFSNRLSIHGHNGLRDIARKLGHNSSFYCLRIGIGHPGDKNKVTDFVLSKPIGHEYDLINKSINEAVYCTEIWLKEGLAKAINRLHAFKA